MFEMNAYYIINIIIIIQRCIIARDSIYIQKMNDTVSEVS